MKSEYIMPFVDACRETFETMCGLQPRRNGQITVEKGVFPTYDAIAIIGLSGTVRGAVMVTMPMAAACTAVGAFVGEPVDGPCTDLTDGLGELLNIIAGAAVARLPELKIRISLPTVLLGQGPILAGNHHSPWLVVPMHLPGGEDFMIKITMEDL